MTSARRHVAVASLAGAALLAGLGLWPGAGGEHDAAAAVAKRPNVVVIMTDDQTAGSVEFMPEVVHHLAERGTTFETAYATHPRCCPSRASYLTGQYEHNHGVSANEPENHGGYQFMPHERAFVVALRLAGYRTAHIGKYMNGYSTTRVPPGWQEWYAAVGDSTYFMYDYTLNENGSMVTYGDDRDDYQTDVFADKAADFIRRRSAATAPFFLSFNPVAPHREHTGYGPRRNPRPAPRHEGALDDEPLPKPPNFNEADVSDKPRFVREKSRLSREDRRRITHGYRSRLASLLAVDDAVARIVRTLRDTRELDETLLIFTSDNAFFHGEHRLRDGKVTVYEESERVPLVVRGPGVPEGRHRHQLVGNIDLAPTIIDAAGVRRWAEMDGRSLLPLADDPEAGEGRELVLENGVTGASGIRTPRYVYVSHATGEKELYDMREDPYQLESLHEEAPGKRREIADRWRALRDCSGEECR